MLGTSMFYGSGAGKLPTASAVVADIIEAVQNIDKNVPLGWTDEKQEILPMDQTSSATLSVLQALTETKSRS